MQHRIGEIKIGPATPARPQIPINQQPHHHPTPAPSAEQISDVSTFNVLQFNANGIGNKLTELGVFLERNKVKVVVIQESKLSSKFKNPCITPQYVRTVPMATAEDYSSLFMNR